MKEKKEKREKESGCRQRWSHGSARGGVFSIFFIFLGFRFICVLPLLTFPNSKHTYSLSLPPSR